MKQLQISEKLFLQLVKYHLCDDDLWQEEIETGLNQKLEAMIRRNLFTEYKTAPTDVDREKARIAYLDNIGMHKDWRW